MASYAGFAPNARQWVCAARFFTVNLVFQHSTHVSVGLNQLKSSILQHYTINFTSLGSKDDC